MNGSASVKPDISKEAIDREVRAIFNSFARQFKDLPGNNTAEKADVFIAQYLTRYHAGHRAAEG